MAKSKSCFILTALLTSAIFPSHCLAEFDNSIGFGVQYAGIFGWQGSWTEEHVHTRIALGLIGATVGVDVNLDEHTSVGATFGNIALASVNSMNINYHPGGRYTQGWRIGLDLGTFEKEIFDERREAFASFSFGYSFK